MKRKDFDQLSYASRKEIVELRNWAKQMVEENDDLIYERVSETVLHEFLDKTNTFSYNIQYAKPNEAAGSNYYKVYLRPSSLTSNVGETSQQNFEQIRTSFSKWVSYVNQMREITDAYYNPNKQFYNNEFKDFFSNNDPDAATAPFDADRQEILYYFLTYAENKISISEELSEEAKYELKEDIDNLKRDIPELSKKATVKSLSKIAQKVKSYSNNLFHLVFDVLKKEIIKQILYKGAASIPHVIDAIKDWLPPSH